MVEEDDGAPNAGWFFGYGSLVNADTHAAPITARPAVLAGWRRRWGNRAEEAGATSLTAAPDPATTIQGLLVQARDADHWAEIDRRERGYDRVSLGADAVAPAADAGSTGTPAFVYQTRAVRPATEAFPILQSYVDAVLQGYLRVFGREGAEAFVATTDGWDGPILDDRAAPRYPRAVTLTSEERAVIDALVRTTCAQ